MAVSVVAPLVNQACDHRETSPSRPRLSTSRNGSLSQYEVHRHDWQASKYYYGVLCRFKGWLEWITKPSRGLTRGPSTWTKAVPETIVRNDTSLEFSNDLEPQIEYKLNMYCRP